MKLQVGAIGISWSGFKVIYSHVAVYKKVPCTVRLLSQSPNGQAEFVARSSKTLTQHSCGLSACANGRKAVVSHGLEDSEKSISGGCQEHKVSKIRLGTSRSTVSEVVTTRDRGFS